MSYIPDSILPALKRIEATAHTSIWELHGVTSDADRQHELVDILFDAISKEIKNGGEK